MELYRAKITGTDKWCEGVYVTYEINKQKHYAIEKRNLDGKIEEIQNIIPDSLCLKSAYKDKKKNYIYEKDIIVTSGGMIGIAVYSECDWYFAVIPMQQTENICYLPLSVWNKEKLILKNIEVIGNIYDNSDLVSQEVINIITDEKKE